jgi:3-deoxy-manno-octulosonate cytidylyltransferase (CMP-KDO synthetase)
MCPIRDKNLINNPNVVKVVTNRDGYALLFSRAPIPFIRDNETLDVPFYRHIGVYAFRRPALLRFASLQAGPLEKAEKLENLRFLEYGMKIKMIEVSNFGPGIDVPEELEMARAMKKQEKK